MICLSLISTKLASSYSTMTSTLTAHNTYKSLATCINIQLQLQSFLIKMQLFFIGVISILAISVLPESGIAQLDLTTAINASGTNVVLATISRLDQSAVFTDDNRLLRRVAFAESRDGLDPDTFREGYNGGIWQVDEQNFLKTTDRMRFPFLTAPGGIYERLLRSDLGLDWAVAVWEDLRRPLISALAARIFFELAEDEIPGVGDVRGQGQFWKSSGFNDNDEDTVEEFVERITNLELEGTGTQNNAVQ